MGLAERERAAKPRDRYRGQKCSVQAASEGLDQEDADALHRLVFQRLDLTAAQVEEILEDEGLEVLQSSITRHRRGKCRSCRKG